MSKRSGRGGSYLEDSPVPPQAGHFTMAAPRLGGRNWCMVGLTSVNFLILPSPLQVSHLSLKWSADSPKSLSFIYFTSTGSGYARRHYSISWRGTLQISVGL